MKEERARNSRESSHRINIIFLLSRSKFAPIYFVSCPKIKKEEVEDGEIEPRTESFAGRKRTSSKIRRIYLRTVLLSIKDSFNVYTRNPLENREIYEDLSSGTKLA